MPGNKPLIVDSRPRLSVVMDIVNVTLAHGPDIRLLDEFYNKRVRKTIDRIVIDETFRGYGISREFRMLGISELVRDMVLKMVN